MYFQQQDRFEHMFLIHCLKSKTVDIVEHKFFLKYVNLQNIQLDKYLYMIELLDL